MNSLLRRVHALEEGIIALLLVVTTLLVFVEVILRFGFNTGVSWAQEGTLHLSAWLVLFGASYGVRVGAHIGVDAFVRTLSRDARRAVSFVALLLCLVYCGLFLWGAWVYLSKMQMIGIHLEDIPIPKWQAHSILLIGFVLLTIRFLELLWMVITDRADGFAFSDEAKDAMRLSEQGQQGADGEAGR